MMNKRMMKRKMEDEKMMKRKMRDKKIMKKMMEDERGMKIMMEVERVNKNNDKEPKDGEKDDERWKGNEKNDREQKDGEKIDGWRKGNKRMIYLTNEIKAFTCVSSRNVVVKHLIQISTLRIVKKSSV
jgi:hypothetical protein